jgi:polysaccharide export outer membrane protein
MKTPRVLILSTLAVLLVVSARTPAQTQQPPAVRQLKTLDKTAKAMPNAGQMGYEIGPDDLLRIDVWKEAELSGTVTVRPDGRISMPLLNDVQAAGSTPMELAKTLSEKLKSYLADPYVTIEVVGMNSRRVFVVGEVNHSGEVVLVPEMTVLQALSAAGGLTPFAKQKKIYVLRGAEGRQAKLAFNYKEAIKAGVSEQNIRLQPGDTIVVP